MQKDEDIKLNSPRSRIGEDELSFFVCKNGRNNAIDFYISYWYKRNNCADALPVQFKKTELYTEINPLISVNENEAQKLMDQMWSVGIRPSNGEGSVGQLAATENHLNDMRSIVAKYTGTKLS